MRGLLDGSGRCWEQFIERYSAFVATVVRRLLRSHRSDTSNADVEDISENTFLALMENDYRLLRRYDSNHKLATYLGVIARTQVHRWLRSKKPVASLGEEAGAILPDDRADTTSGELIRGEARDAVRRALEGLNERDQTVLRMVYYEGANYQDVAEALGVKVNSVGAVLTRARTKFQTELKRVADMTESDYRAL